MTRSRPAALEWLDRAWAAVGVEGVVTKPALASARIGWRKIRHRDATEVAVLGVVGADTLVLGVPATAGWRAVGLSQPVPHALLGELAAALCPQKPAAYVRLPGNRGRAARRAREITYLPAKPDVVVEIEADTAIEYGRWRHRPRILRCAPTYAPKTWRDRPLTRLQDARGFAATEAVGVPAIPHSFSQRGGPHRCGCSPAQSERS